MKQSEQATLLLRKAAQDEALLDEILTSETVSDEIIGFHCQQAAEKLLKALLSNLGIRFSKTHELGALALLLTDAGHPLPSELEGIDALSHLGRCTDMKITIRNWPWIAPARGRCCTISGVGSKSPCGARRNPC
jgi:hypothetical protein